MVQLMELWYFADINTLKQYYGQGFNVRCLIKRADFENNGKKGILCSLKNATKRTSKGEYNKGSHSFKILERVDPALVVNQSQWAKRFVELALKKMDVLR